MGQRQKYEGPDWERPSLLGELDRRGITMAWACVSDNDLRRTLMADDEKRLPKVGDRGPWIWTISANKFYPYDLKPEDISMHDIAYGLALECRFARQLPEFYSVAEHSVRVTRMVTPEHYKWALLHDAAEAYMGDIPSPWKKLWPEAQHMEELILRAVAARFNLAWPMPPEIKIADEQVRVIEANRYGIVLQDPPDVPPKEGLWQIPRWNMGWREARTVFWNEAITLGFAEAE